MLFASEEEVVFRSDVSLVRVDVQVLDRDNRAVPGLRIEDFVLREGRQVREIRNFARENMPVDVLFLLDVSGSMRPHVQRVASAAHQALRTMGKDDRVAIMVFDRMTRVRSTFKKDLDGVDREFEAVLRHETFNGGTDITRALFDAADYIGRQGRRDARRAIVIVTDDETEFDRNEAGVERALVKADAVLSALIAPNAMGYGSGYPGGGRRGGYPGGGYPRGGGRGRGGIILGIPGIPGVPGGGGGGGRGPGPQAQRTQSAGTSEIARESGGDSLPVDGASALEDTLDRIRRRYALHFLVPAGVQRGEERSIDVQLSDSARRRYPDAELRFRRTYIAPETTGSVPEGTTVPTTVTQAPEASPGRGVERAPESQPAPVMRRRPAMDESNGPRGPKP